MKKLLAIVLIFTVAGCARTGYIKNIDTSFSENTSIVNMEKSINNAAKELGWTTKKVGPNTIEATLNLRIHTAVVTILYTGNNYKITYKSSSDLRYNAARGTIHKKYNTWVANLNAQIKKEMKEK